MRELNAAKDKFFSVIAHDLRGPIQWFKNLTEILSQKFEGMSREKLREVTASLEKTAKQSYHLVDNLLYWSRSQTGRLECRPEKTAVRPLPKKTYR